MRPMIARAIKFPSDGSETLLGVSPPSGKPTSKPRGLSPTYRVTVAELYGSRLEDQHQNAFFRFKMLI